MFLAVAEYGSTAAAARALNLSQPSVSVALKELEGSFGQKLFQRLSAKGMAPTVFGLRKLDQARQIAARLASFQQGETTDEDPSGSVAFGYFSTLGPQYVPAALRLMAKRHPRIEVSLQEADLAELNKLTESGRVELALSYAVEAPPRAALDVIGELTPYALLPTDHPLAREEAISVAALAQQKFVLIDLPLSRDFLLSVFRAEGVEPQVAYRTTSLEMAFGMVANGLGVSVLVTRQAGGLAYDGRGVVRRKLQDTRIRQRLILQRPAWAVPTMPVLALARCIKEIAQSGGEVSITSIDG
ncbi:LysR family transcriptional regulator [Acidocella sp. KAb 2-4]|uniref:LysR family transcriptional regulator n=1 Tax=Acidocella sp. KAb 2-4 TaxID=2885158 RepID=UPI001D074917|nr:LysR family transcriptional regulator [Acidocella sp. KAb 2-4]